MKNNERKAFIDKYIKAHDIPELKRKLDALNLWLNDNNLNSYHPDELPEELRGITNDDREAVYMWQWQNGQIKPEELTVYQTDDYWLNTWTGYPIGEIGEKIPNSEGSKEYDVDEDELEMDCAHGVGLSYVEHKAELYPTIAYPYTRYVKVQVPATELIAYKSESDNEDGYEVDYEWQSSDMDLVELAEYDFNPVMEEISKGKFWGNFWKEFIALESPNNSEGWQLFNDKFSNEEWELFEDELKEMYEDVFEPLAWHNDDYENWWDIEDDTIPTCLYVTLVDAVVGDYGFIHDRHYDGIRLAYARLMIKEAEKLGYIVLTKSQWRWEIYDSSNLDHIMTISCANNGSWYHYKRN